jgi:hypothetical protein
MFGPTTIDCIHLGTGLIAYPEPDALTLEKPVPPLTAREVYQQLRDAALGLRPLQRLDEQTEAGLVQVDIERWRLSLDIDGVHLRHCVCCHSADDRVFDGGQRFGTDPVSLLSTWELAQIERLLTVTVTG